LGIGGLRDDALRIYNSLIPEFIIACWQIKKGGDFNGRNHRLSTNEGGWDWRVISFLNNSRGKNPLNPFK
jgi:hypothetical protein